MLLRVNFLIVIIKKKEILTILGALVPYVKPNVLYETVLKNVKTKQKKTLFICYLMEMSDILVYCNVKSTYLKSTS